MKKSSNDKQLLFYVYAIMLISAVFYFGIVLITDFYIPEGPLQLIIIFISTLILFGVCFIVVKIESEIGYYKCKTCNHIFKANFKQVLWAMHIGTTRYLNCPKCNKKSWCKKVFNKE